LEFATLPYKEALKPTGDLLNAALSRRTIGSPAA
jgi:hypothetical protein